MSLSLSLFYVSLPLPLSLPPSLTYRDVQPTALRLIMVMKGHDAPQVTAVNHSSRVLQVLSGPLMTHWVTVEAPGGEVSGVNT